MTENVWTRVRFDEMAQIITDRVEPSLATEVRYVGLEHLDPEDLEIHRWGHPSDVKGSKYRVKAGQIIFGKRRFYQKKIAVAPFDCICSAHAMVLQEQLETVAPGFLPHFMLSDEFVDRALLISEGSLSPTIKWRRLAEQEFAIPPLDRQREIAEVLNCASTAEAAAERLALASEAVLKNLLRAAFTSRERVRLGDVADISAGATPARSNPALWGRGVPWVKSAELHDGTVEVAEECITAEGLRLSRAKLLPKGTLLMAMYGATAGRLGTLGFEAATNQAIAAFLPRPDRIRSDYLYWCLLHERKRLRRLRGGAAQPNLSRKILGDFLISVVPLDAQDASVAQFESWDQVRRDAVRQSNSLRLIRTLAAEKLLSGRSA